MSEYAVNIIKMYYIFPKSDTFISQKIKSYSLQTTPDHYIFASMAYDTN